MMFTIDGVFGMELLLSWDPAQTGDWCGITLVGLEGIDLAGAAKGRILGCGRHKKVTYDIQTKQIVRAVEKLYDAGARGVTVVIDSGGVGRGLMDTTRALSPLTSNAVGISLHGGSKSFIDREFNIVRAAKLSVVSFVDTAFASGRLTYDPNMPGLDILTSEIQGLRANTTAAGNTVIEAGKGNDDVIFSLAQGWYAVASPETGPPLWSAANLAYFEQLSEAHAPVEHERLSQVTALKEPVDSLLPVRKAPYRFTLSRRR